MTKTKWSGMIMGAAMGLAVLAPAASAQSLFSPAVMVNDRAITHYEIQQRMRMMELLQGGATEKMARDQLINERLQVDAAAYLGSLPSEEAIRGGITEFAGRADMDADTFLKALKQAGVEPESMRDFVIAGLTWRDLVRAKFGGKVQISEDDIDRAVDAAGGTNAVNVLISEVIIPITPENAEEVRRVASRIAETTSLSEFAQAARTYSASATRGRGGRINWMALSKLPPQLRPRILALAPGEVTEPLPLPNAIALFQLRAIEETTQKAKPIAAIEYAELRVADAATAAEIVGRVDTCDDLYAENKGQADEILLRESKAPGDIPADVAIELAKLDKDEVSTTLRDGAGQTRLLMMCGRTPEAIADTNRQEIATALRNQRFESFAKSYLEQLRADARIIEK